MSKKNNLKKRRDQHAFNLKLEKQAREEREKKAQKVHAKQEASMKVDASIQKKKKKGIRIKKNVVVRGIKIKDAASKKKALALLKSSLNTKSEMEGVEGAAAA